MLFAEIYTDYEVKKMIRRSVPNTRRSKEGISIYQKLSYKKRIERRLLCFACRCTYNKNMGERGVVD